VFTDYQQNRFMYLTAAIVGGAIALGAMLGLLSGAKPLYLGMLLATAVVFILFFLRFEQAVLGLLILRSAIDGFTSLQLPSIFAIGLNILTLLYVVIAVLTARRVYTDKFWWFFAGWWLLQGLWIVLLAMGALGYDASYLSDSIREWVRLFSWVMVYLLVMQLKDRVPPQRVISALFLALIVPIAVAILQLLVPNALPVELSPLMASDRLASVTEAGLRIRGSLGHPNGFTTFLFLFIALTIWKLGHSENRWFWLTLLGTLAFFYVQTKALFGLPMLAVFLFVLLVPRLSPLNLVGGGILFGGIIALFGSTPFGKRRLESIANTPLLNPDIDVSRAILLSQSDYNSFNWRIAQWYTLLTAWQHHPLLGYGLGLSIYTAGNDLLPHNDYIRFLVEGGIIGLIVALSLFVVAGFRLIRLFQLSSHCQEQQNLCMILFAMLVAILVGMITENIWGHTMLFFYWWTLLAVAGWDWQQQTAKDELRKGAV
jgi:O-antigen ligase